VLSEPERTRIPVLVGEANWARRVDGRRVQARLAAKALNLSDSPDDLDYAICARDEVANTDPKVRAVTAADIFPPAALNQVLDR
jgi:uncharacterized protein